ncbi:MAG TPA: transketolase C-terminal domain-containing protein [Stellaceae bacterium]|jgi:transketolase
MSMRKQFVATVSRLLAEDPRVVLLLGDIGVFGFNEAAGRFPDRVYNIGILEQATVSLAAGLAKTELIPIVHTIAPFLTERCLEQIKVDFGYQALGGNFVTVGASYDYAALGCTHHCPGDVQAVTTVPGVEVIVPGTAAEFDRLFRETYDSGRPTYFRLAENEHRAETAAPFGQGCVVKEGKAATVVVIGPLLESVLEAARNLDVTVLYYHTVQPFDGDTLRHHAPAGKVLLCEPYYRGGLAAEITEALWPRPVLLRSVGVPRRFLTEYGKVEQHDAAIGLAPDAIRAELEVLIHA